MPKTIKNKFHEKLTYDNLMKAHINCRKNKIMKKDVILYLRENLYLELNSKTQIFKSKQGINFCGYKINEYRIKLRDKGKKKIKIKIKKLKEKIKNGEMTSKEAKKYLCGHYGYIKYAENINTKFYESNKK